MQKTPTSLSRWPNLGLFPQNITNHLWSPHSTHYRICWYSIKNYDNATKSSLKKTRPNSSSHPKNLSSSYQKYHNRKSIGRIKWTTHPPKTPPTSTFNHHQNQTYTKPPSKTILHRPSIGPIATAKITLKNAHSSIKLLHSINNYSK